MEKKARIAIIILTLIIIIILIIVPKNNTITQPVYTDEPSDWIVEDIGVKTIDINAATAGKSFVDSQGQQVRGEIDTVFDHYGFYHGQIFSEKAHVHGLVAMQITNKLTPGDGVIEGFALFKFEDKPMFYFFVDDDWKENIVPTNIWWDFDNKREFEFTEISPGIYMDKIEDTSFSDDYKIHYNKVYVGDMTDEKLESGNEDMTFMVIE